MVIQLTLELAPQTLAAYPRIQTRRITSLPVETEISSYLALLHAEIARFTRLACGETRGIIIPYEIDKNNDCTLSCRKQAASSL